MNVKYSVVFCDDIRQEVSGKHIIVGMYSGDLIPETIPTSFPMSIMIRVQGLTGKHSFQVTVSSPGGKHGGTMGGEMDVPEYVAAFPLIFVGVPVQVDEYGDITVDVSLDGTDQKRVGTLAVKPLPEHADLPPSS